MPVDVENVQPPVVVRIEEAASPNHIQSVDTETRLHTYVFKNSVAYVAVKVRNVNL